MTEQALPPVAERADAPDGRRGPTTLLRENTAFRNLWLANVVSLLGSQVSLVALPLTAVIVLDAGPAQMGYLTALITLPNLIFALHFGAWIDRRGHRRQTMIVADIGRAALLATIPLAYAFDALTLPQLYVVGFLGGTLGVLFNIGFSTVFAAAVPRERLVEANQIASGTMALSYAGGSSLGGAMVQILSAPVALVGDALSFLVSAFFLRRVDIVEPPTEEATEGHISGGIRFIRETPIMLASLASTATINLFTFAFYALFFLYTTRSLEVGPGVLGLVVATGAIGGVIGAVLAGAASRRIGVGRTFLFGSFLFPAALTLVPAAAGPRPLVLAMLFTAQLLSGIGLMLQDISANSISLAIVPDRLRSRVEGAYMVVNYGVRPLGALAGGLLATAIGMQGTLWIATTCAVAGAVFLVASPVPSLHDLPDQLT